jgi:hypothetical protein
MKKKLIKILVILYFLSVVAFSVFPSVSADISNTTPFDLEPLRDVKHDSLTIDREFAPANSPWWYPVIDDYTGELYWIQFVNPFNGTFGNIWVGLTEYDEYIDLGPEGYSPEDIWLFGYPWTPEGIPGYLPEGYRDAITGQDLLEVLDEFDTNIHETDVEYFGMYNNDPAVRPGPYGDGTVQIMVFNVRDDWFYDPDNALGFIEGYFWSLIADAFATNAFHMDSFQWWRRQGGEPPMIDPYTGYDYSYMSPRTWEYEGTFAHEFQHLIHYDRDPDELSWVDEGCATLAEWLCGYGFSPGHISEYLLWFWDTPLTIWEGFLADYGASFLWTFYMYEHYGGAELLWDLVQDPANGIEGWENALAANGIDRSFDQIFQDWCIANYLDDTSFSNGRYGYYELDLPSVNSDYMSIPFAMELWDSWYPDTGFFDWYVDEYPYDGSYIMVGRGLPYTASYVEFFDTPTFFEVTFNGDDFCGAAPTSGDWNWFSGGEAWSYYKLGRVFDLTTVSSATLTFANFFSIEADWDYGYVEVHNLDTDEWTTLSGLGTTTDLSYIQDNPNCPDDIEPSAYSDAGEWNCFTGDSYGLYFEEMDLTPFAGSNIELFFVYWTDGYSLGSGWYIDDIEIPELGYHSDVETDDPTWTVNAGWYRNDAIIWNDFEVSFIKTITFTKKDGTELKTWNRISKMHLNDETEEGKKKLILWNSKRIQTSLVMVVANQPGYEHTFGTSYTFTADRKHWRHRHRFW